MKKLLLAGVSALALGFGPMSTTALAQQGSGEETGSVRGYGDRTFRELTEIIPAPDVADDDLELGRDLSSDGGWRDRGGRTAGDDVIDQGEEVPEGIRDLQDSEAWDGDFDDDTTDDVRGRSAGGPGEPARRDRARSRADDRGEMAQERRQDRDRGQFAERREELVRNALRTARRAFPEGDFNSYRFAIEDGRRVIQIVGTDPQNGRKIQVDVRPNGRVHSLSQGIPLEAVPESVRSVVRGEMGRMRVAHASRSLHRNLDFYYQFAGFAESGRPVTVEIRADGKRMSVDYSDMPSQTTTGRNERGGDAR